MCLKGTNQIQPEPLRPIVLRQAERIRKIFLLCLFASTASVCDFVTVENGGFGRKSGLKKPKSSNIMPVSFPARSGRSRKLLA